MSDELSQLLIEVFRVNGLALAAGDVLAKPAGLSSARWQILGVVDHAPTPVSDIARTMGLARQSVQQTADALENEGFVLSKPNPNHARAKFIVITQKGRKALRQVERRHQSWVKKLSKRLEAKAVTKTLHTLRELVTALEHP